jgi:hypothetical protein
MIYGFSIFAKVTLAYRGKLRADLAFEPVNAQEQLTKNSAAPSHFNYEQRNVRG